MQKAEGLKRKQVQKKAERNLIFFQLFAFSLRLFP